MANLRFVQAQSFQLQASGASSGDTSITLQSFKQIDGVTNILTADLGDKCYATLEPNNGTQEEAISFTGVTQNASGTATLTGVKSVAFVSPYTETTGLSKSHAGGVTFILSNDAGFYGNIVTYINSVVASGAALADTTTAGISKLSVSAATGSNPIVVGDNDPRLLSTTQKSYLASIINTGIPYAIATGSPTAYTATLASSISSLASGTSLNFLVPVTNATGVTLNVNSLGAKTLKKGTGVSLASGDIIAGQITEAIYDGTNFQIQNPASAATSYFSTLTTQDLTSTTTKVIPHGLGVVPKMAVVRADYNNQTNAGTTVSASSAEGILSAGVISLSTSAFSSGNSASGSNGRLFQNFRIYATVSNGGTGSDAFLDGTISMDSTNISIVWNKTNTPTGTANILVWAIA